VSGDWLMQMERVIQVINRMQADGVIGDYAIGGGIAAIYYLEPYDTGDIDVFVPALAVTVGEAGLISLEPIYGYLRNLGCAPLKAGVLIEDWLVQFIPTFEPLHEEAITKSRRIKFGETETKIFTAEYLAAELLRSGGRKDQARVIALIEGNRVDMDEFRSIVSRHGLSDKWKTFARQFDLEE
jgi:hypothetical protein